MDERRVGDYFVVAGLLDEPEPLGDFSRDGAYLKATFNQAPITDVAVIFPSLGEEIPPDYYMIETTPTGFEADLNHGSLRSPQVFLCYRRGRDQLPLVDIGVMYEGKERIMSDSEVVLTTPGGRVANVNNSGAKTFVTYRRAPPSMPCNELVVTDICVILTNKGETPPHAFCMISKNLNKGMVGSDVYLCYKKSMNRANLIPYKPGILARYPLTDYSNFPLPATVPMFCLPMGSSIECWPSTATQPRPVFSTFVLTVSDAAEKVYGSAVTFYERVPAACLTAEQCCELQINQSVDDEKKTVNINKCICLLSHWPFFDTFEKFLLFLYEMACSGPHTVPIERYISHFLKDVPFPSPQRPRILIQLSATERVVLTQPEDLPLPRSGAGFRDLLMSLGPDNCLMILLLALTEQKLLVHSLRPDVLTAVAEAVSMIIFPFKWQCPYIPLCPLGLAEVLHAPLPFLIGVDSRFFDLYDPPSDVNCVDLDTNNITVCEEKRGLTVKFLPKKPARVLRNTLEQLTLKLQQFMKSFAQNSTRDAGIDRDFQQKRKEVILLQFTVVVCVRMIKISDVLESSDLKNKVTTPTIGTTDPSSLFDLQGFLRSREKTHHKFFTLVMKTQMFIRFIEERSFVSDMDASLAFFDECTEKVENDDGDGRLLELDESHQSERTVFILPPEPNGLPPGRMYSYKSFMLDPLLFSRKELTFHNLGSRLSGVVPGSPMARRTKHEIKSAQKLARKHAASPELWAKCLLTTCYSLWFLHLPSYAMQSQSKAPACLQSAYEFLVKIQKMKLQPTDEVCYRVMMQLCGVYSQPVLAVKLLSQMKRSGIQPNAITYGYYNRAVLEATWPSDCTNSSQLLWNKLRNVIIGVALFRHAGVRRRVSDDSVSLVDATDVISHTSLDSGSSHQEAANAEATSHDHNKSDYAAFDRFRSRVGSIVRPSVAPLLTPRTAIEQQPCLLMTGLYHGPTLSEEKDLLDDEISREIIACVSPSNPRRRNRSGSCSEFMFGLRQGHLPGSGNSQGSPKSPRSSDTNSPSECFRLLISSPSCKTSPVRTPVTENDPLGALDMQETAEVIKAVDSNGDHVDSGSTSVSSIVGPGILEHAEAPGGPVLYGGHTKTRGVSRSATFGHDCSPSECSDCMEQGKPMHRSSTMPVDVPVSTVAGVTSGLGGISSSFKLPFSRYSPARLSLRKADLLIGTQIIENAITNFRYSSNSTFVILISEFSLKDLSCYMTLCYFSQQCQVARSCFFFPVGAPCPFVVYSSSPHQNLHGRANAEVENLCYEEDPVEGNSGPERRVSSEFSPLTVHQHLDYFSSNFLDLFGEGSRKGSSSNLQPLDESGMFYRDHHAPVALELMMTTCSKCHNCLSVLHDEEILAGWVPEDSNLNTKCQFCGKATVPFLTVNVTDYRGHPMAEHISSQESVSHGKAHISNFAPMDMEPITVPYLNPLVLRKEFENILHTDGDICLTQPRFVDEHPIIFWNMVWIFQRINIESHLPGLCLHAASVNRNQVPHPSWENCDHNNVAIRCMWDNRRLHEEVGQPMYALWQQNEQPSTLVSALITDRTSIPRSVMQMVISGVRCNDLLEPLKKLAIERQKLKGKGVTRSHSLYWDILFLAFTVMGRDNIDHAAFDRKYMAAYEHLPERDLKLYQRCDKPPSIASLYCRHYFKELEL
ncbi:C-myc promoter-binding protein [Zootermopsis nevadensis]|uniref:C-myc promoter-binding protein n=1 Tax=Zootermopsis nevadensis TaxID=136037 RepID=A0A067QUL7_ZOONE|nr:C-myc promoter-binding protein [Zootermopsis nevadensis]